MEPQANLNVLDELAGEAAAAGATYALSPEVTVVFAENREGLRAVAGRWENNPHVARAGEIAKRHGIHLHLGSMAVALPNGRFANRSILFRPEVRYDYNGYSRPFEGKHGIFTAGADLIFRF